MDIDRSEISKTGYRGGNMTHQPIVDEIQNAQILETSKNIQNASTKLVIRYIQCLEIVEISQRWRDQTAVISTVENEMLQPLELLE